MLRTEDLTLRFGEITAVDDVSIEVGEGEIVALLGPSGSGKSSLLRLIAGLTAPDSGTVLLDGRDVTSVPVHERPIGLMFQDYALFPHLDVERNVGFGLKMEGWDRDRIEARVREVLTWVGLAGYQGRSVDELSGGEQQRVALARTMAPRPRLLMLDEPVGSLDRALRARLVPELSSLLRGIHQSAIYVTHDQDEAFAIADRLVILDEGRVRQAGPPRAVWSRPADEFVARFLGFENLADARVQDGVAATPWGAVATDLPDGHHRIVLRPDAIRLDEEGALVGEIEETTFGTGETRVLVRCLGEPLVVEERGQAPPPGTSVRVHIDPDGLHSLGMIDHGGLGGL